jgi:hypothetical protein
MTISVDGVVMIKARARPPLLPQLVRYSAKSSDAEPVSLTPAQRRL